MSTRHYKHSYAATKSETHKGSMGIGIKELEWA